MAGCNPELTIVMIKKLFQSYSEIFNEVIHKISRNEEIADVGIIRASQSAGLLLLSLTNALHRFENNTASIDVYREELGMTALTADQQTAGPLASLTQKTDVLRVSAKFDVRAQNNATAAEATHLFSSLMATMGELVLMTGIDYPRDAWNSGVKLHVDRAGVYNIQTKSSAGSSL